MRFLPKARVGVVVTKEEKEARLKAFIGNHIATIQSGNLPVGSTIYRLLALSADSVAARALNDLAADISAAGIKVEAVLARHARNDTVTAADCRFVNDLRLLDAHEQLVLDHATAWIGDCMRRDPLRRDAYEQFVDASPDAAAHAARSFDRIWRAAGPSGSLASGRSWTGPRLPNLFDPSLLAGVEAAPPPALIRH